MTTCIALLGSGSRKGKPCGAKCPKDVMFCKRHNKLLPEAPLPNELTPFSDLSQHVVENICKFMISFDDCQKSYTTLMSLRNTSKWLKDIVDCVLINDFAPHVLEPHPKTKQQLTTLQRLELQFGSGCMICKKPNIRKVYLPIPLRLCAECFKKETIKLEEYCISSDLIKDIDQVTINGYNPYVRGRSKYYTQTFVLRKQVEKQLDCSVEKYRNVKYSSTGTKPHCE
jgi:hypothetical protein